MQCGTLAGLSLPPLFGVIGWHLGPWSCGINQNFAPTKHVDGSEIRRWPPGMYKALYMMVDKLASYQPQLVSWISEPSTVFQRWLQIPICVAFIWNVFVSWRQSKVVFWFPHKKHIRRWIAPKKDSKISDSQSFLRDSCFAYSNII